MRAYRIKGQLVKVERCAADLYIVRNIPGIFDNRMAIGAIASKKLVQSFLDSWAVKCTDKVIDTLDVDFENCLPLDEVHCRGCVYWNGKGCDALGKL